MYCNIEMGASCQELQPNFFFFDHQNGYSRDSRRYLHGFMLFLTYHFTLQIQDPIVIKDIMYIVIKIVLTY